MARNAAQRRGGSWLKMIGLGLVAAFGLAAAAVIIPPMLFKPDVDVALIKAEETPFKIRPQDPGGVDIAHTETTVMGMIDDLTEPKEATEVLRPPSAVPEMPPTPVPENDDVAMASEPQPAGPLAEEPDGTAPANADPLASGDAGATDKPDESPSGNQPADMAKPGDGDNAASQDTASEVAMPQSKPAPPKRVVVEGDEPLYVVQLAAFRKAVTAREQAGLLAGKHKARLEGAELGTMKTDTGDDGVFWRVVTEPLSRTDADSVCASLKRAGQDCILRKYVAGE